MDERPITNTLKNKSWNEKIKDIKLEPTLNWTIAEI